MMAKTARPPAAPISSNLASSLHIQYRPLPPLMLRGEAKTSPRKFLQLQAVASGLRHGPRVTIGCGRTSVLFELLLSSSESAREQVLSKVAGSVAPGAKA